ncbi:hypothetical protein [Undibacterium sp.]|uniref:hypothetical protein n=1 Tax=Undibacterium sp. TaxID=1914977 RepID=UPI0025EB880E|nr:hypothetical protein [Undibacterium sp.]
MSVSNFDVAIVDNRPFFESALVHGLTHGIIDSEKIAAIKTEAPKGMVQIAAAFGSKYLRPEIEAARKRIVNLASLYLLETSNGDLDIAAKIIRDNSFLSLSRGGSTLLKTLFAMPEIAMFGREEKGSVEDFLEFWSLKEKTTDYRSALAQRKINALEIEAGFWFGEELDLSASLLQEDEAEAVAVIRSAMLIRYIGLKDISILNQIEFASLLDTLRVKAAKLKPGARQRAKLAAIHDEIPVEYQAIAERVLQEITTQDMPKIADASLSLDRLVYELKERYYIRDHEVEDTSDYDALVSKEWSRLTKGKTDIDSLLTLFLCITAGIPPKTSLPEKTAKSLLKKIRASGMQAELAIDWIKTAAPHEKQEGLLQDWSDFVEESQAYLMDDWDTTYSGALRFLSENCHIEKPRKA